MLPGDLNFDISEKVTESASSRSGLSQQLENYGLHDEQVFPDSQPSVQPITPDTTIGNESNRFGKKGRFR
jgi:hypothetical protein